MKFNERLEQTRKRRYGVKPGAKEETNKTKAPNCYHCADFEITWDVNFPYGCKAMGFKTRKMPTQEVFEASGMQCQMFKPKVKKK